MTEKKGTLGRPPIFENQKMHQRMVTIDNASAEILTAYGNGNFSKGIRKAAELAEQEMLSFRERD